MDNSIIVQIIIGGALIIIQGNMWFRLGKMANEISHIKEDLAELKARFNKQFVEVPKVARRK